MDREIRLGILILVWFVSYVAYLLFNLIVIIPDYCSGISAYWLYGNDYWSPFWMFAILFSLILLWSLAELIDSFLLREDRIFSASVIGVVFIFNACFFAGHYTLWQLMEIQQGKYSANFLFSSKKIESLRNSKPLFDVPEMHYFLKRESCKNGIEVFDLEKEDRKDLLRKYHQMVHEIMESNSKIKVSD